MQIYKHYFDKKDTPFVQDYQTKQKYHTSWKHFRYKRFLGHKVVKIKLLGIITIYDTTRGGAE